MRHHSFSILALLFTIGSTGCGQATDDTSTSAPETITVETRDGKSDSIRTHEMEITIDRRDVFEPRGWGPDVYEVWRPRVELREHSDTHIRLSIDELIFRPPADIANQHGQGWMAFVDRHTQSLGTAFSIMVWHRPAGSDDEWTPIVMPTDEADPRMGQYFDAFGVDEGEAPELARLSDVPEGRCEVVVGVSNGPDRAPFDTEQRLPELDDDGAHEFRLWVIPNFNFCEWTDQVWLPEVIVTPLNTGLGNTA